MSEIEKEEVIVENAEPVVEETKELHIQDVEEYEPIKEEQIEPSIDPVKPIVDDSFLGSIKELYNDGLNAEEVQLLDFDEDTLKKFPEMSNEEKRNVISNSILNHVRLGSNDQVDEIVRSIIKLSYDEGFDINNFVKPKESDTSVFNWDNNTVDENFKFAYSRTYGKGTSANMTEEEINQEIQSQSLGFKKAFIADFRKGEEAAAQEARVRYEEMEKANERKFIDEYNNKSKIEIENLVREAKDKTTFSGFLFSQADKEDFIKQLPNLLERKVIVVDNGQKYALSEAENILRDLTKDGQSILKLAPFLYLHKTGKLDAYTTMLTQKVKEEFINKLDDYSSDQKIHRPKEAELHIQDTE